MENFEKSNRIDELEKKLYSPNQKLSLKTRKPLREKEYDVANNWGAEEEKKEEIIEPQTKRPNWFFRFFIFALLFCVGAGAYLGVTWYLNSDVDASNVDILVNAPLAVGAGEDFNFEFTVQNKNQTPIKYTQIDIVYPEGTRSVSSITDSLTTVVDKVNLVQSGEILKRNQNALLFGEEGDKKEILISFMYQVDGSTKIFKKEKRFDVVLSSTPIRMTIINVKETTTGQDVEFNIEAVSNSSEPLKDILIQAVYPYGFSYKSSTLEPQEDKKSWIISSIQPKESINFKIKGTIDGQNQDEKHFKFLVGLKKNDSNEQEVIFTTKETTIAITRPFLELDLSVNQNNKDVIILDPSKTKDGVINYKNNTSLPIQDAVITLKLVGSAIVESSINVSEGFYQSVTDTMTWDGTTADKLISIPVGKNGQVGFNFSALTSTLEKIIENPEVLFTISVKGNRASEADVPEIIENTIVKKIRFNSEVSLTAKSLYYTGPIQNIGPIPPKAEDKTTYTVNISLKNTSNNIGNGVVTMKVPNYVQYDGVFQPNTESIVYDQYSRTITWNVGDLKAKTGYFGTPIRELYLQVSIIPSLSQLGFSPEIINTIKFSGTDLFTRTNINVYEDNLSTAISDAKDYHSSQVSQ